MDDILLAASPGEGDEGRPPLPKKKRPRRRMLTGGLISPEAGFLLFFHAKSFLEGNDFLLRLEGELEREEAA